MVKKRKVISRSTSPETSNGDAVLNRLSRLESLLRMTANVTSNNPMQHDASRQSTSQSISSPISLHDFHRPSQEQLPAPTALHQQLPSPENRERDPTKAQDGNIAIGAGSSMTDTTLGLEGLPRTTANDETDAACDESVCSMAMVCLRSFISNSLVTNTNMLSLTWNTLVRNPKIIARSRDKKWYRASNNHEHML